MFHMKQKLGKAEGLAQLRKYEKTKFFHISQLSALPDRRSILQQELQISQRGPAANDSTPKAEAGGKTMYENDTIAAISTPAAVGGIGMVRISGENAFEIADQVFCSVSGKKVVETGGYRGMYGKLRDGQGEIDEAVTFVYHAPKSYTGENVVELCCHGGLYLVKRTLRACIAAGARLAQPGEFTKRAFLNGKMGLTEAEAVMDLISAQGSHSAQAALSAREGAVYRKIHGVADQLLALSAGLAAWTDYPDEDIEEVSQENLTEALSKVCGDMNQVLKEYDTGKILREGVDTVIVGRPNVGKSTLMNLLSGTQKSIVTQIPGTTRDIVEDTIQLGDVILNLADTAGLRETDDPVEKVGVELANRRLDTSYLILAVFDSSEELSQEDKEILEKIKDRPVIGIINKSDLQRRMDVEYIRQRVPKVVEISAASGEGTEALSAALLDLLSISKVDTSAGIIANERQRACVMEALSVVNQGLQALKAGETLDAVGVCIDAAIDSLLSLTGEKATEAVVEQVFARFCVGK